MVKAQIPPLDPRDAKACYDPGVTDNPVTDVTTTRTALASCKRKHANVVRAYDGVVAQFGASANIGNATARTGGGS